MHIVQVTALLQHTVEKNMGGDSFCQQKSLKDASLKSLSFLFYIFIHVYKCPLKLVVVT